MWEQMKPIIGHIVLFQTNMCIKICFSQSQSPPSPKKLPSTKSETTMSPKNELKDGVLDIPDKSTYAHHSGSDSEGKINHKPSSNSIQFELGAPKEPYMAKLQVCWSIS